VVSKENTTFAPSNHSINIKLNAYEEENSKKLCEIGPKVW
jgi:hypothetical protein